MDSKENVATVARKSSFLLFVKLAVTFLSWVGVFFVLRFMSVEDWGMIGFALGFVGIFLQTDYGFGMAHNKRISEGCDVGECLGAFIRIKVVLILVSVGLVLGGLFVWESVLGHGYEDPMIKTVIFIVLLFFILFSIAQIPIRTFGGLTLSAKQQLPELFGTVFRVPIMIFVAITSLGVIALAFSYVVTGLLMVLVGFFLLRRFEIKKSSKSLIKSYTLFATPIAIYLIISSISLNVDKVAIQFFWNYREVGYFFAMQRLVMLMTVIALSITPILFPSISYYHSRRKKKTIRNLLSNTERYLSMILVPIVVFFSVLSMEVIHIFVGDQYLPASNVLIILSIYALFFSLSIPHIQTLFGCGLPKHGARVGIIIALANTILIFILVPQSLLGLSLFGLGAEGAAIACLISVIIGFVASRYYTRRLTRIRFKTKIYRHWLAGIVMAFILVNLANLWLPSRWYELLFVGGIGLFCYLGILTLVKEFKKKDLNFFLDMLNPRKLKQYVKDEFKE